MADDAAFEPIPQLEGQTSVDLATAACQVPQCPHLAAMLHADVTQLNTHNDRNPVQLPEGAVLIVGTGQSSGQIAEELHTTGRGVRLSVSIVPATPPISQPRPHLLDAETGKHGPDPASTPSPPKPSPPKRSPPPRCASRPTRCFRVPTAATPFTSEDSASAACTCTGTWRHSTTVTSPSATTSPTASRQLIRPSVSDQTKTNSSIPRRCRPPNSSCKREYVSAPLVSITTRRRSFRGSHRRSHSEGLSTALPRPPRIHLRAWGVAASK